MTIKYTYVICYAHTIRGKNTRYASNKSACNDLYLEVVKCKSYSQKMFKLFGCLLGNAMYFKNNALNLLHIETRNES